MDAPLWRPRDEWVQSSVLAHYMASLEASRRLRFASYDELWRWSVDNFEDFWQSIWDFFEVRAQAPYARVLGERTMPGAEWFAGATLNYAEHALRHAAPDRPAIIAQSETRPLAEISWAALARDVAAVSTALRALGVGKGDRVAAYLPNLPEAVVALLACASIGAVWSSCSPDMGAASVADRFQQIAPALLIAADGYRYGGKDFDRRAVVAELQRRLPSLRHTVLVPCLDPQADAAALGAVPWAELLRHEGELLFEPVPFDHPLWVLYSSGTTGLPKPIVQGHGGILLEHLKALALHCNLGPHSRFCWFTTTGWMMWNFVVGGLLVGATILLFDGSPGHPDLGALWRFAEATRATFLGASAAYVAACMKADIAPGASCDLRALEAIGSTGSPLPAEGFRWLHERVGERIWLVSLSGGTDVCTAFVGGCPLLPVYAGEIQCRCLGAAVAVLGEAGEPLEGEPGELVLTEPMPSMPLFFWGDEGGARYRESYFEHFPGVWRHGDWASITPRGGVIIYGRSDATINRMGVRMGTSEIYRAVEELPAIADSLVVDLEMLGRPSFMALFVQLAPGAALDDALLATIRATIRAALSPRHVPDAIYAVPAIPRTLNGKKLELPVKKILLGAPPERAANPGSLADPAALEPFVALAATIGR
jgi:acetoacetyl-CoA synthetase